MRIHRLVVMSLLAACGGSDDGGGGGTVEGDQLFKGTLASSADTGVVTAVYSHDTETIAIRFDLSSGAPSVTASGPVSGSHASLISSAVLPGPGGWKIVVAIEGDSVSGGFTDADGNDGNFAAEDATDSPVLVFCGQYSGGDSGRWNLEVGQGRASGAFSGGAAGTLTGSRSGSSVSLQFDGDLASGTATGTISGMSISGSWKTGDSSATGSWSGSTQACGAAAGAAGTSGADCCSHSGGKSYCPIEGC